MNGRNFKLRIITRRSNTKLAFLASLHLFVPNFEGAGIKPKRHGLVVRAVACGARGPRASPKLLIYRWYEKAGNLPIENCSKLRHQKLTLAKLPEVKTVWGQHYVLQVLLQMLERLVQVEVLVRHRATCRGRTGLVGPDQAGVGGGQIGLQRTWANSGTQLNKKNLFSTSATLSQANRLHQMSTRH